ncbi:hypothetical protein IZ6_25180 [Terrihabitans soli]|uniref:Uncharacterized protein n=1 Tax=Terrihabitans soli TaxID=708113 RepID=A0A6S6QKF8_9HYPH|nr:hypothetical protein [Terrihabitans soli]BCJ91783.1 hypothetical protein IZ6_25180 [Terrihabitans soli]
MPHLGAVAANFRSIYKLDTGLEFSGTIHPAEEGSVPSYEFTSPRLLLRLPLDSSVPIGAIMLDGNGRRFLIADHGFGDVYRVHRLFQLTHQVPWARAASVVDLLTGLNRSNTFTSLGTVWCLMEPTGREFPDRQTNAREETRRVITSAALQLGDKFNNMIVKRIDELLGVKLVEIQ